MNGMNRYTGQALSEIDHVHQSIHDILTTPIGTRVMRRQYGSRLSELIDAPMNRAMHVDVYSAVADALLKWEPRLALSRVTLDAAEPGKIRISVEGTYRPSGQFVRLEGINL